MPEYLYLDIETLPTSDPSTIAEITASVTPPKSMSKPETIAAWETESKPTLVREAIDKTALNGAHGKICCIGWAWDDAEPEAVIDADERQVLGALAAIASQKATPRYNTVVVGHNVASFDIRYLWQRAFVLGITMPTWLPRDPKPWSDKVHDTMAMWAGARDFISLDNLCKALGLPGKGNMSGADVAGMWQRGEREAIAAYCRADVERVRSIHRKMLLAMGEAA